MSGLKHIIVLAALVLASGAGRAQMNTATLPGSLEVRALSAENKMEAAYERAALQVKALPNSAEAHYWLGATAGMMAQTSSIFSKLGYAKEVVREFEKAAELDPKQVAARFGLIEFHLAAPGMAGGDKGKIPGLVLQLDGISKPDGLRARAMVKMRQDDVAGAEALYRQVLAMDAGHAETLAYFVSRFAKDKLPADTGAIVQAAITKAPGDVRVQYQFAKFAAISGQQPQRALDLLTALKAVKPVPEGVSTMGLHFRSAQLLEKLGKPAEALAEMQRASAIAPKDEQVVKELARMRKTQG